MGASPSDPDTPRTLAQALSALGSWEVPHASAVIVGPAGVLESRGEVDLVLPIASLSKPLTAATVLLLAAEGVVELDEPVGPTGAEGATLRHLLSHASGLGAEAGERVMQPGRRRVYSNWSFEVAAELASQRTGAPFPVLLRERLLGPLGMDSTALEGSPAHGATSTAADLARFMHELIMPVVLDAETHRLLTEPFLPELDGVLPGFGRQRPNGWTLGLEVRGTKEPHWAGSVMSPEAVGHFGRSGSLIWADLRAGMGLASLSGREFGPWAAAAWPALNDAVLRAGVAVDAVPVSEG